MKKFLLSIILIFICLFIFSNDNSTGEVKLDLSEYLKIMKEKWEKESGEKPDDLIVPYVVTDVLYKGDINKQKLKLNAVINFEVFSDKWQIIPIIDTQVGIYTARLDGKSASFSVKDGMYNLVIKEKGKHKLELDFDHILKNGNCNLNITVSPINNIKLLIKDFRSNIVIDNAKSLNINKNGTGRQVSAVLGYSDKLNISVIRKIEEKESSNPVVSADVNTLVTIGEAMIHCSSDIFYFIREAKVSKVEIIIPKDVSVLNINGDGVVNYYVEEKENNKILTVEFNLPIKGEYNLLVEYEKILKDTSGDYEVPIILLKDTARQKGFAGIQAITNIEIKKSKSDSITNVDVKELPQEIWKKAEMPLLMGFKYLDKGSISLELKRHSDIPLLSSICEKISYTTVITKEGSVFTRAVFTIRNTYDQFMKLTLPKDSILLSALLSGKTIKLSVNENGELLLPLEKSDFDEKNLKNFDIEIIYKTKLNKFKLFGITDNYLCDTKFEVQRLEQTLWLPSKYRYLVGNKTTLDKGITSYYKDYTKSNIIEENNEILEDGFYESQQENQIYDNENTKQKESSTQYNFKSQKQERIDDTINKKYFKKGTLPVEISIPTEGIQLSFSKTLPQLGNKQIISLYYIPPVIFNIFTGFLNVLLLTLFLISFLFILYLIIGKLRNYPSLKKKSIIIFGIITVSSIILSFFTEINVVIFSIIGTFLLSVTLIFLYEFILYLIKVKKVKIEKEKAAKIIFIITFILFVLLQMFAERANLGGEYFGQFLIVINILSLIGIGLLFFIKFIVKIIKREMVKIDNKK